MSGTIGFPICFSCDANGAYEDEVEEDEWDDADPR